MNQFLKSKLKINGLNLNYFTWGDSTLPPLFFIHGWMDTGASFHFLAEKLKQHFYCIAPDLRGFGHSDHTTNPLGYFFLEYVADVHDFFNHFSPHDPVKILGHSMGGNILSFYAGSYPERVSHFVNVEGFGIQDMPADLGPIKVRKWLDGRSEKGFKKYATLEEVAARFIHTNPRLDKERALFLASEMSLSSTEGYQIAADPKHKMTQPYLFQMNNFEAFLKPITASCLLVAAEKTEMGSWMPSEQNVLDEIKRRMQLFPPDSQKVIIPDCGHMIHHEKSEELAALVLDFLLPSNDSQQS